MAVPSRSSLSSSASFFRPHAASSGGAAAAAASTAAAAAHAPAPSLHAQQDFWTHHDIDYSWRFPWPDHQQKEFYSPPAYLDEAARKEAGRSRPAPAPEAWRSRDRLRTQCVCIVACLNIGVDPPDQVKPTPCARVEAWVEPESMLPAKALKAIGGRLQMQYERWHERAKYKTLLDPTAEELRKTLLSLRRSAGDERVLLHYNGHGVPRPTANGEIWVYNKGYTQYIPVSLYDLQTWMGGVQAPAVYVFDASAAGVIVDAFMHFMRQRRDKMMAKLKQQQAGGTHPATSRAAAASPGSGDDPAAASASAEPLDEASLQLALHDPCRHILLASCGATETLPLSADLPADLFTACLTTPVKMSLRWFVSRSTLHTNAPQEAGQPASAAANRARMYELIEKLPGIRKPSNRKSPFGELNWIFTAITDSIAWNVLPRDLFQKLFRQDLLVSSMFRNFLLAQRIMSSYGCGVISVPALPQTHLHPLWQCWDLASDIALSQLERHEKHATPFTPSTFFEEQLTSFEIWLEFGSAARPPPMQLPVVLQVLLSTDHRLRALQLLARFMDKGGWAVNLALSVGIFPYVLKLLQSPDRDLREVLVFIWAKILSLDRAVQQDLAKVEYASYFIAHLSRYASGGGANAAASGSLGQYRPGSQMGSRGTSHSRTSSVAPSPSFRPNSHSVSNTPLHAPLLGGSGSGSNSAMTTPLYAGEVGAVAQFPLRAGTETSPSATSQLHHAQAHATRTSSAGNPPPLDLPPSSDPSRAEAAGQGNGVHSAHLRDHPPPMPAAGQAYVHMRAQPLHDPAAPLTNADWRDAGVDADVLPSGLPPAHPGAPPQASPSLAPRLPHLLDLSSHSSTSPLHSPTHAAAAAAAAAAVAGSARPSPSMAGIAFSPLSPMLSPQMRGSTGDRDDRPGASQQSGLPSDSDAHELTRIARECLASTNLQHLLSLFLLACIAHSNPRGQQVLLQAGLSLKDLTQPHLLFSADWKLRQWACLALGKCWQGFGHAKTSAAADGLPEVLGQALLDPVPAVRCAALWSLGVFFGGKIVSPQPAAGATTAQAATNSPPQSARVLAQRSAQRLELEIHLGAAMAHLIHDASPLVRRELMLALSELVYFRQDLFLAVATAHPRQREAISPEGWFIWRAVLRGCRDCTPAVQEAALEIKGYLKKRAILNQSQLGRMIGSQHNPGLTLHSSHAVSGSAYAEGIEEEEAADITDSSASASRKTSSARRDSSPPPVSRRESNSRNDSVSRTSTAAALQEPSLAHIDADDLTLAQEESAENTHAQTRDAMIASNVRTQQQHNQPTIRHFNRYKMGHLRPGAAGPGAPPPSSAAGLAARGEARRNAEKTSLLQALEAPLVGSAASVDGAAAGGSGASTASAAAPTLDERASDTMWSVPKSRVFEDAYAAFAEPMLTQPPSTVPSLLALQADAPSMSDIRQRKWRHARNQAILSHARELRSTHPAKGTYVEVAFLQADWESTSCVCFHPFEPLLIAADAHNSVGVWSYIADDERGGKEKLNLFSNDNPIGSKITQLEIVNDASVSLLLVASDDGVVRIWRNAHEEGKQGLVTAWVANPTPEVRYNLPATPSVPLPAPLHPNHQPLDNNVVTPSQSYQDGPGSAFAIAVAGSSLAPHSRMTNRMSSGVGMPIVGSVASVGMRHSASTPALALSAATPTSRTGSLIPVVGSLLPSGSRSPVLKASQSPTFQPTSAAMNIPSYSLAGGAPQRHSPSQSPPHSAALSSQVWPPGSASSRRKQRPPLIVEWQQHRGRLLASGNGLESLRIWDVSAEQCVSDIPIFGHESLEPHLPTHVTSMSSNAGDMVWLGCFDGALRCCDMRLPPLECLVSTARLHRSPVQSVRLQRHGQDGGMLISAAIGGDIALADIRMVDSSVLRYYRSSHREKGGSLDAFAVHDYSPICASGSHKPFIEIFDHSGATLDTIRYHVGFLGQRIGPIQSLAFHRHKLLLAAGALDSYISIFAGEKSW